MQLHVSASAYVQQTFKTVLLGYGEKNTEQKELHQLPFSNILFNISINNRDNLPCNSCEGSGFTNAAE